MGRLFWQSVILLTSTVYTISISKSKLSSTLGVSVEAGFQIITLQKVLNNSKKIFIKFELYLAAGLLHFSSMNDLFQVW
jgi:hypothetical protein